MMWLRQRCLCNRDSYLLALYVAMTSGVLGLTGCYSPPAERRGFDRLERQQERLSLDGPEAAGTKTAKGSGERDIATLPVDPTLQDYIDYAVAHHPDLEAAFQDWRAALNRVPQARALPDPNVNYTYFVEKSMNVQTVSFSQTFPWYGKLAARHGRAMEEALAAEERYQEKRREVIAEVKQAYAEYAYLARALEVARENRRIRKELRGAAEAQFESGTVPYADVAQAEVALDEINDRLASLKARRGALEGRLNAALGRSGQEPLPWPQTLSQPRVQIDEEALLKRLPKTNPELQALEHQTASRRQNLRLAKQNWIPDFSLGVGYHEMFPENLETQYSVVTGFSLPLWWGRLKAERKEARAALQAADRRQQSRRYALESKIRLAWYRFNDAERRLKFYKEKLLPGARESLEASEAAYSDGQVEFQALTQAQSKLQELQLTSARLAADRFQNLATLERLVGRLASRSSTDSNAEPGEMGGSTSKASDK